MQRLRPSLHKLVTMMCNFLFVSACLISGANLFVYLTAQSYGFLSLADVVSLAVEVPQYPEGSIFPKKTPVETVSENQVGELELLVLHRPQLLFQYGQFMNLPNVLHCSNN